MALIPEPIAHRIYDILVQHAGARDADYDRRVFVLLCAREPEGCREFRFGGTLGFGGKFYAERGGWRVSCYPEDRDDERAAVIVATNAALRELREEVIDA